MRKTIDQIISDAISLVHEEDRSSLQSYLDARRLSIEGDEDDFPGYFSFDYEPYLYAIRDRETFYRYAAVDWHYEFEEEEDRLIIGQDLFHLEETLYLSKSDGCVYYENFANQSIKVAASLWEIWNLLFEKYPDVREEIEVLKVGQRRVDSLDENSFSEIIQYASNDQEENVRSILRILGELSARSQSKDKRERPCLPHFDDFYIMFGDLAINKDNFFQRSAFEVKFPLDKALFVPKNADGQTYGKPYPILQIAQETEDDDTGIAQGFLYYDPRTRKVCRIGAIEDCDFYWQGKFGAFREEDFPTPIALGDLESCLGDEDAPELKLTSKDKVGKRGLGSKIKAKLLEIFNLLVMPAFAPVVEVLSFDVADDRVVADTLSAFLDSLNAIDSQRELFNG